MSRLILVYAVLSYILFLGVTAWMAAFLLDFNAQRSSGDLLPWPQAAAIDIILISVFGLVHSIMARPGFKRTWTRIIPPAAERATYVLQSSVLLGLIFLLWQPIDFTVWHVQGAVSYGILAVFCVGMAIIGLATVLLDHFEFTGLRQAWDNLGQAPTRQPQFRTPFLYRIVRHPLQLGIVMVMFAVPHMTADGFLFAIVMLGYILIGLRFEERALLREFGPAYRAYQRRVPMLLPRLAAPTMAMTPGRYASTQDSSQSLSPDE